MQNAQTIILSALNSISSVKTEHSKPSDHILLGHSHEDNPVYWQPELLSNQHALIVGGSGETKTNFAKNIIAQDLLSESNTLHIVHDIHGEYGDLLGHANGSGSIINIAKVGLPFPILQNIAQQPIDIRLENIIADLRASNPQIGNVQTDVLRKLFQRGMQENWSNLQLRSHLEKLEDLNLKAQIYPFLLLLRSDGIDIDILFQNKLLVFNLSAFQDPKSRAAFVILIGSQIFQYQQTLLLDKHPNEVSAVRVWIEEASVIKGAKPQLTSLFQEARKFHYSATYITQVRSDVPEFVSRNCATQVFFRSAAVDHPDLKKKLLPENLGEAVVRMDEQDMLVKSQLFQPIDNQATQQCVSEYKSEKIALSPDKVWIAPESSHSADVCIRSREYLTPDIDKNTFRERINGNTKNIDSSPEPHWQRVFGFKTSAGLVLLDNTTGMLIQKLTPLEFSPVWQAMVDEIGPLISLKIKPGKHEKDRLNLLRRGLLINSPKGLKLADKVQNPPIVRLPPYQSTKPRQWSDIETGMIHTEHLDNLRCIAGGLWGITLPREISEILLPVHQVESKTGLKQIYPAWGTNGLMPFMKKPLNPILEWL